MRTLTLTAMMATLFAIPLILQNRRARLLALLAESDARPSEDIRRYDVFDFIS